MPKLLLPFVVSILFACSVSGQTGEPEKELHRIREVAYSGNYDDARKSLVALLDSFPDYGDARILLGRVLAWQGKYDEGLTQVDYVLSANPSNSDALEARTDILRWKGGEAETEDTVVTGIGDELLLAGYSFDTFTKPYSRYWQIFRAGGSLPSCFGRVSAFLNAGHLFSQGSVGSDFQAELEVYPIFSKETYGWANYAMSQGKHFPHHRLSAELWHAFSKSWFISGGFSYFYFDRGILIPVAGVEKYVGRWWINGRVNLHPREAGASASFFLHSRRYFTDFNYLQVTAGLGTAPDEPYDLISDIERYSATTFRVTWSGTLTDRFSIRAHTGYSREEHLESVWRNRFEGGVLFSWSLNQVK